MQKNVSCDNLKFLMFVFNQNNDCILVQKVCRGWVKNTDRDGIIVKR